MFSLSIRNKLTFSKNIHGFFGTYFTITLFNQEFRKSVYEYLEFYINKLYFDSTQK